LIPKLLEAHQAWRTAPDAIEIAGKSDRGGVVRPIKITATRREEILTEYGGERPFKEVATPELRFRDDGVTLEYADAPSGFGQLDVTGLFFLAQLREAPGLTAVSAARSTAGGADADNAAVRRPRAETHYADLPVSDAFELRTDGQRLLAGIARTFYPGMPFGYTLAYAFSDYRQTNGVWLPYRIEVSLKGRRVETIAVERYIVEVPASPQLFAARDVGIEPLREIRRTNESGRTDAKDAPAGQESKAKREDSTGTAPGRPPAPRVVVPAQAPAMTGAPPSVPPIQRR
jgi:hypothetical protein